MRILAVSSFWHPRGGDTTSLFATMKGLAERGHEVVPFAMRHPDNLASPWEPRFPAMLGITQATRLGQLARLPAAIWSRRCAAALEGLLGEGLPDVAHVHHLHRHLTPAILPVLRRAGVPIVWTVHDYELICPNAQLYTAEAPCERCRGHRYHQAVRNRCKGGALLPSLGVAVEKALHAARGVWGLVDTFLCPSRFLADRLVRFGVDPTRVVHLPNLVDAAPVVGEGAGAGWLYAGRLTREKGVHDLLAAARLLPDVPLTICGDGPELPALRAQAPAWVRLPGTLPRPVLAEHIARAAVVAVPSRWPENDPYAVLEAQRAARPVVACAVGGIPEQITHGVDGWLVPPGDPAALAAAVRGLLVAPDRAIQIGRSARERVLRTRDRTSHLDAVEALYRQHRR